MSDHLAAAGRRTSAHQGGGANKGKYGKAWRSHIGDGPLTVARKCREARLIFHLGRHLTLLITLAEHENISIEH
jgi:hypothetical protein